MKERGLLVLATCTLASVVAAAAAIIVDSRAERPAVAIVSPVLPELAARPERADTLTVETADYRITLKRQGEGWVAGDRGAYPVRAPAAAALLTGLGGLRLFESKTADPTLYDRLGVAQPVQPGATLVRLADASNASLGAVLIGRRSESLAFDPLGGTFVRRPDTAPAWLAQGGVTVPATLSDWLAPSLDFPATLVSLVAIREGGQLAFETAKDGDRYATAQTVGGEKPANDSLVKRLAQTVVSGTVADVRARPAALPAPERVVTFALANGLTIATALIGLDGARWIAYDMSSTTADGARLAADLKQRTDRWLFKLPDPKMAALDTSIEALTTPPSAAAIPQDVLDQLPPELRPVAPQP